jgi:predicted transcriptional regulator
MRPGESSQQISLLMPSAAQTVLPTLPLQIRRHRRAVRSQRSILLAILEACRTPTVQHWIMVKARLGYDTFWKHMNMLVSKGMMDTSNDGYKTLYYVNQKGIEYLRTLESIRE